MTLITIKRDGEWFVITDEETGITTQGKTKIEALLMLADALALEQDDEVDLMGMARFVFEPTEEQRENLRELANRDYDDGDFHELTEWLAEETGTDSEEIERGAEEFEIELPEEAGWEFIDEEDQ